MRHFLMVLAVFFVAIAALAPGGARAQTTVPENPCAPPTYRTDIRPGSSGPATEITFGLRVADLLEIDDVNQTISIDLAIRMRWTDPRLAAWDGCKLSIDDIWFPDLVLKNSGRMFSRWPETVSVEEGGKITYLQRISGSFSSYHKLTDFPFDKQTIALRIYPLDWSIGKVVFRNDEAFTGMSPLLNISDWAITGIQAELVEETFEAVDQLRSGYLLQISAERYLSYYFWKIMLPISLIVFMSWCVFWINPEQFGTQLGLSATSVLTMIAFIFSTTSMLPRLGYFTMLDRYVAGATVFVFLALLQSLCTGYLASKDRTAIAGRIDLISRFAFPLAFFALCAQFYAGIQ
ncbi:Cys-loop ligand-gated ion channel (plasmid) [Pseudoseohaeicola sp. NH-UV-7]